MFRDFFRYNVLNQHHLDKKINGNDLETFIETHSHGQLTPIYHEVWLWTLNEEQLKKARPMFKDNHLLL